jgi:protocatechuate 3,4-dioxygenase, beta subunit
VGAVLHHQAGRHGHRARASREIVENHGGAIALENRVIDVWQANTHGRYDHEADPNPAPLDPNFQGWARFTTDAEGRYRFTTIKPGAYPVSPVWTRPPHIHFKVARRGYHELTTQMYFAGHELNEADRLLLGLPDAERSRLMVEFGPASAEATPHGSFDIVLRRV